MQKMKATQRLRHFHRGSFFNKTVNIKIPDWRPAPLTPVTHLGLVIEMWLVQGEGLNYI